MTLLMLEIKKYLFYWKKILAGAVFLGLVAATIGLLGRYVLQNEKLIQSFVIGIVNEDESKEMQMLMQYASQMDIEQGDYILKQMSRADAQKQLQNNQISAYVLLDDGFLDAMIQGENMPLDFYGRNDYMLNWQITKSLGKAVTSYISVAQAGIYATLDYAAENEGEQDIQSKILYPINIAFLKKVLARPSFIEVHNVRDTGDLNQSEYILFSGIAFLMMIWIVFWNDVLQDTLTEGIILRYKASGFSLWKLHLLRFLALYIVLLIFSFPVMFVLGGVYFFFLAALAAFALLISSIFQNMSSYVFFVSALIMLFLSGGIIPLVYLPKAFTWLSYLLFPHWVLVRGLLPVAILSIEAIVLWILGGYSMKRRYAT